MAVVHFIKCQNANKCQQAAVLRQQKAGLDRLYLKLCFSTKGQKLGAGFHSMHFCSFSERLKVGRSPTPELMKSDITVENGILAR